MFGLKPDLVHYPSSQVNEFFLLASTEYLSVGAGGKGPALRFDDKLKDGSTFECETFNNELLHGRKEGSFINDFVI